MAAATESFKVCHSPIHTVSSSKESSWDLRISERYSLYRPAGVSWGSASDLPFGLSHDGNVKTAIEAAESPAMGSMIFYYSLFNFEFYSANLSIIFKMASVEICFISYF